MIEIGPHLEAAIEVICSLILGLSILYYIFKI